MTQADIALTGERAIVPTGKSFETSRRSMLGAVAALAVVALPAVAVASESPLVAQMRASRESANAKFWKLHDEHLALEAEWSACPDEEQEREKALQDLADAKWNEVMLQPVFCPLAVLAKLKMTNFVPGDYCLPYPAENAARMIEWDLDRCAKATRASH